MRSEENGTLNESDLFGDTNSDLMSNLKKITDWKKTHGKGNEGPFLVLYDSKMPIGINVPPSHAVPVDAVGDQIHPVRTDLGGDPAEIVPIFKRDHRIDLEHQ